MMAKRPAPVRGGDERRRRSREHRSAPRPDAPPRKRKPTREQRPAALGARRPIRFRGPPTRRPGRRTPARPRRVPRPERPRRPRSSGRRCASGSSSRLASIELDPRTLVARVPFVVLVIGSLGRRPRRHAVAVDRRRRALVPVGPCAGDQSGAAATEGSAGARGARGAGRAGAGRGRAQPRHDPVEGHRAPGAGSVGQLDRRRHTQTRPGRCPATAEHAAARGRPPPPPRRRPRASSSRAR